MEESELRRHWRSPFLAGLLNVLFAPLGHVYAGQAGRGICLFIAFAVRSTAVLCLATQPVGVAGLFASLLLIVAGGVWLIADAALVARRQGSRFRLKRYNRWYVYLATPVLLAGINTLFLAVLETYLPTAYSVRGTDMEPTLLDGDRILVDQMILRTRAPRRGEIVVFRPPHQPDTPWVKRVVALPNETVEIRHSQVYIAGKALNEPYLQYAWRDDRPAERVPEGHLFVIGDNRDNSNDCRHWGTLPRDRVSGVVRTVYFSWDRATSSVRWERIARTLPSRTVIPSDSR